MEISVSDAFSAWLSWQAMRNVPELFWTDDLLQPLNV